MTYLNQPNQSSSILYNRALKFFADSVSSVDVQVSDGKI